MFFGKVCECDNFQCDRDPVTGLTCGGESIRGRGAQREDIEGGRKERGGHHPRNCMATKLHAFSSIK